MLALLLLVGACQGQIVAQRYFVPQTNGAACLDGSPPAYYVAPGSGDGANKFVIFHNGGGWCISMEDCAQRAKTAFGSSTEYPVTDDYSYLTTAWGAWYLSNNAAVNPMMYNWNRISIMYCDGASWTGQNTTVDDVDGQKLYFRGHLTLQAQIADFLQRQGLDKATEVVLAGASAGALAVFLHIDEYRKLLPAGASLVGLADAGFFLDYPGYREKMQWVFQQNDAQTNAACMASFKDWHCMLAQYVTPFVATPVFALQSKYDVYQIYAELGTRDPVKVNAYGAQLLAQFQSHFLNAQKNGAFVDDCFHHTGAWPGLVAQDTTAWAAFGKYYPAARSGQPPTDRLWSQNASYPCPSCCPCPCGCTDCCVCDFNATRMASLLV